MSFLEETSDFFTLVKESNFDLGLIYSQNPNGIYVVVLILLKPQYKHHLHFVSKLILNQNLTLLQV